MSECPVLSDEDWDAMLKFTRENPIKATMVNLQVWEAMATDDRHRFIMTGEGPAGLVAKP
jgi:hypothetical protein